MSAENPEPSSGSKIELTIDEDRIRDALASEAGERRLIGSARRTIEASVRRLVALRREEESIHAK